MTSSVTWFGSRIIFVFLTFKILLLWNSWTDRDETLNAWPPVDEEQKVHTYDVIRSHGLATIFNLPNNLNKIHHSKEVLARVCNLWLLFFLFKNILGLKCSRGAGIAWQRYVFFRVPFSFNLLYSSDSNLFTFSQMTLSIFVLQLLHCSTEYTTIKVPDPVEVTCLENAEPEGLWSKEKHFVSFLFPQRA